MVRTNVHTLLTVFVRLVALVFVMQALLQGVNLLILSLGQGATDVGFFVAGIGGVCLLFGLVRRMRGRESARMPAEPS